MVVSVLSLQACVVHKALYLVGVECMGHDLCVAVFDADSPAKISSLAQMLLTTASCLEQNTFTTLHQVHKGIV